MVCATVGQFSSSFVNGGESPNPHDRFRLFLPSSIITSKNGSSSDPKKLARRCCDWFMTEGRPGTEIRARDVVDAGELARIAMRAASSSLLQTLGPPLDIVRPDDYRRLRGTIAGNSVSVVALALLQAQSPPDLNACSQNNPPGMSVGKGFGKTSFDYYTAVRCQPSRIHQRPSHAVDATADRLLVG